jgi:hypothetical protein
MMTIIAYDGGKPDGVSQARWEAMKKFFKRNFQK